MFLPEIKRSLPAFDHIKPIFIRIIALMFAHAGLIRPNHPATMYGMYKNMPKMKFSDLLGEAWFNLKTNDGVTPYHYSVFISVIMMICMMIAGFFIFITNILVSTASAQLFSHPSGAATDFGSVPPIASGSLFDTQLAPAANPDLALGILDKVLRQAVMGNGGALQNALGPLMQTYNTAILVIASLVIFWAIISIVVDTARTGQIGGGRHSMVWVPIRFVFSLGLMIPLASGFNSGQLIVIKLAEWGSNLGSTGWFTYAASVLDTSLIAPVAYNGQVETAVSLAKIWTCAETYNMNLRDGGGISANYRIQHYVNGGVTSPTLAAANITAAPQFNNVTIKVGNRSSKRLCGMYKVPNPMWSGLDPDGSPDDIYKRAGREARRAHLNAFVSMLPGAYSIGCSLAIEYNNYRTPACVQPGAVATNAVYGDGVVPTAAQIDAMVTGYVTSVNAGMATVRTMLDTHITGGTFMTQLQAEGWAGMGKWYHTISSLNKAFGEITGTGVEISDGKLEQKIGYEAFVSLFRSGKEKKSKKKAAETALKFSEWWDGASSAAAPGSFSAAVAEKAPPSSGTGVENGKGAIGRIMNNLFGGAGTFFTFDGSGSATYPLASLSKTGQDFVNYTLTAYAAVAAMQVAAGAGASVPSPFVSGALKAINEVLQGPVGEMLSSLLFTMMIAGLVLVYYIPLLPWIRVTFSVLSWIVSIFEAVVVAPLLALANLSTEGDGLFTQTGRTMWISGLNILLRPILTVIGFVASLLIFNSMVLYVNDTFNATTSMVSAGGFLAAINWIVYTVIYVFIIYTLANTTFKLIDDMPNTVSKWIGGPRDENYQDSAAEGFIMAASQQASSMGGKAHGALGKSGKDGSSTFGRLGRALNQKGGKGVQS
jgi:conjugal transfer/type IV secretion protein DotA/TraY